MKRPTRTMVLYYDLPDIDGRKNLRQQVSAIEDDHQGSGKDLHVYPMNHGWSPSDHLLVANLITSCERIHSLQIICWDEIIGRDQQMSTAAWDFVRTCIEAAQSNSQISRISILCDLDNISAERLDEVLMIAGDK